MSTRQIVQAPLGTLTLTLLLASCSGLSPESEKVGKLAAPLGQTITLKATNGRYVVPDNGSGKLNPISTMVGTWEQFQVVDAGGGYVALKSIANGKYVTSQNTSSNNYLTPDSTTIGTAQKFTWQDVTSSKVALKALVNGRYVVPENGNGYLNAISTTLGGWEQFDWAQVPTTPPPPPPTGTTYYVATNGSDSNPGSSSQPFATLQKAFDTVQPGQTVVIKSGTYTISNPAKLINKAATASSPIYIRGENMPVIKGNVLAANDTWWWQGLISIENSPHVTVNGVRVENSGWFGFKIENSSNVTIQDSQSAITLASAIYADYANGLKILNNDVTRFCDQKENVRPGTTCQEGISVVHTDGFEVAWNKVHDSLQNGNNNLPGGGEGIDAKQGSKNGTIHHNQVYNLSQLGIYVDAWDTPVSNIEIYGNKVWKTAYGIQVASEASSTVSDIRIHDNVVYDNGYHGINVSTTGQNGPRSGIKIYNNTVVNNGKAANKPAWCVLYGCSDWGYGINIDTNNISSSAIHDNIVVDNHSGQMNVTNTGAVTINKNLQFPNLGVLGSNAIIQDPLFVNKANKDFHLTANSPARGVGVGGDPLNVDADNNKRSTTSIDLGAYIYEP